MVVITCWKLLWSNHGQRVEAVEQGNSNTGYPLRISHISSVEAFVISHHQPGIGLYFEMPLSMGVSNWLLGRRPMNSFSPDWALCAKRVSVQPPRGGRTPWNINALQKLYYILAVYGLPIKAILYYSCIVYQVQVSYT
ncbi:hypothetical protein BJ165DRAFT_1398470 [Panaeolus papilionaceus]|nr:hypothetical protein BJ165DRAFT_1398470 [Panaeolus papilionaceus]